MAVKNFQTLRYDVPLKSYTSFKSGGHADRLLIPSSKEHLVHILQQFSASLPRHVFGNFSNTMVRDHGLDGLTIILNYSFSKITHHGCDIYAQSGVLSPVVAKYAAEHGIGGFEFLSGIPGTIGGALAMNAGIPIRSMQNVVIEATGINPFGHSTTLTPKDLDFSYRYSNIQDLIITNVVMRGYPQNPMLCFTKIKKYLTKRANTQPVGTKTGGSTFKNPTNTKAAQLIESVHAKGLRVGDAMMSTKHANFMINTHLASSKDLETLGEQVQQLVYQKHHILLEWEIKRVGRK